MSVVNREARRQQIIQAVIRITVGGGLQAATMRTVANEAGVSVRLVQYYFHTKDQLLADTLAEVGKRVVLRVRGALDELAPDSTPRSKIATIFDQFLPVDGPRHEAMLIFVAFRDVSLTDPGLGSSNSLGLGPSLVGTIEDELKTAVAEGDGRVGLDPYFEAVMLVSTMVGVSNEMLAGGLTERAGRQVISYALDLAIPGGSNGVDEQW